MAKEIKRMTILELCTATHEDGLVLQGCGGDPQEWLDGINQLLTMEGIFENSSIFTQAVVFEHEEQTNILFPFDDVHLNIGKLAIWRLQTHSIFGCTWLSDYLPNKLGIELGGVKPTQERPNCPLIGEDGNIFNLIGMASRTLKENNMSQQATEMCQRITESGDYDAALRIIGEYVNIVSQEEMEKGEFEQCQTM